VVVAPGAMKNKEVIAVWSFTSVWWRFKVRFSDHRYGHQWL